MLPFDLHCHTHKKKKDMSIMHLYTGLGVAWYRTSLTAELRRQRQEHLPVSMAGCVERDPFSTKQTIGS